MKKLTRNGLLSALEDGRVPIGMECLSCNPNLVEIVGHAGFDFVKLDMEHTALDWTGLEGLVRAADSANISSIVRVAENNPTYIRRALETGCHGLMIPMVDDRASVVAALDATFYAPHGTRGMCPSVRATGYGSANWDEYLDWSRSELTVIPMIETAKALQNAEEICSLEAVKVITLGVGDLGQDLGVGARGMSEPIMVEALKRLISIANDTDTAVWCSPFPDGSREACERLLDMGVRVLMYTGDQMLFQSACNRVLADLAPVLGRSRTPSR